MVSNLKGILSCFAVVLMITLVWAYAWKQSCENQAKFYRTPSSLQYHFSAADDTMPTSAVAEIDSRDLLSH